MAIRLRGHHLLCLLGYRGMGYSEAYAANMSQIYERLRTEPETEIELVEGPDDLCVCFPADQVYHCGNESVFLKDAFVLDRLGLRSGEAHPWGELLQRITERVKPEHIPSWCATCQWLKYGVCEEGVRIIGSGGGLRPLPNAQS
jgi:hypothetical protein